MAALSVPGPATRPRRAGFVALTLALVLCLLLAFVSLTARATPPPTIAEFAPQAVEQITDAPAEQGTGAGEGGAGGGGSGTGAGGGAGAAAAATTTVPPAASEEATIDVKKVRRCVGSPPRQIEDPQSPPCVPYWEPTDNGGATSKGVTADEIRVSVARNDGALSSTDVALEAFFNKRFELYGRRIRLIPFASSGGKTAAEMQADAVKIDSETAPFASIAYSIDVQGRATYFYDELAKRGIIGIMGDYSGPTIADEAHLQRFAPYQWNYLPSPDKLLSNYGEFICGSLAGLPPSHTIPPISAEPTRKFGVLNVEFDDGTPKVDLAPLLTKLKACGVTPVVRDFRQSADQYVPAILDMKKAGVTSLMCLCQVGQQSFGLMPAATGQGYFPEWLISNFGHQDDDFAGKTWPRDQSDHVIGLMSWNKQLPPQDWPIQWAVKEINPGLSADMSGSGLFEYWGLLLLVSGIQMAGPRLTPATFQDALYKTVFPNPGAGAAPYYQARVDFAPFNHTMIQDFAMVWWSNREQSVWETRANGAFCYIAKGARFSSGAWPKGRQPFQQQPCR